METRLKLRSGKLQCLPGRLGDFSAAIAGVVRVRAQALTSSTAQTQPPALNKLIKQTYNYEKQRNEIYPM